MTQPRKKRILIVDDEAGFTRLIKLTLEKAGHYTVMEETDPTRAREAGREFMPDIIFLDIVMPKVDGGDVAQQIKADPMLRHIPIIFLTAIVSKKEAAYTDTIGGFPFLAKPVSLDALIQCVEEHVPNAENSV